MYNIIQYKVNEINDNRNLQITNAKISNIRKYIIVSIIGLSIGLSFISIWFLPISLLSLVVKYVIRDKTELKYYDTYIHSSLDEDNKIITIKTNDSTLKLSIDDERGDMDVLSEFIVFIDELPMDLTAMDRISLIPKPKCKPPTGGSGVTQISSVAYSLENQSRKLLNEKLEIRRSLYSHSQLLHE